MTATDKPPSDSAQVRLLLLLYPPGWRARYGEEFAELLAAELADQPRSVRRTGNVVATGLRARLASAGLAGHPFDPATAARAALVTLACAVAACGVIGAAMWSQLAIGLQWSVPGNRGITQAMDLMSAALLLFGVLALLAAIPPAWAAVAAVVRGHGRPFLAPAALVAAGAAVLVIGGRHFGNGWPGTGGHLLTQQSLVPGGIAAFGWAATMWITSYWAHPAALAAFPVAQLAWMALSPAAAGCLVTGAAALLRRVDLSPRAFRYEMWLARFAWTGMAAFLSGALCWLWSGSRGGASLFRAGAIDKAGLIVLVLALTAGAAATRRAALAPGASTHV